MNCRYLTLIFLFLALSSTQMSAQENNTASTDSLQILMRKINADAEVLKRLKFTGYLQAQFQVAESEGIASFSGGNFPARTNKRFMVRRARLKATYNLKNSGIAIQIDANESGSVSLKDAYLFYNPASLSFMTLSAGLMDRPFGFELKYSSSLRESPERGRMSQLLFPNERDMGFMIALKPSSNSIFRIFKLEAGLFNGPGINREFDNKKDFIGRLSASREIQEKGMKISGGLSMYNGGFRQDNDSLFLVRSDNDLITFLLPDTNGHAGETTKREYYGADLQFTFRTIAGNTTIRGEFITGTQTSVQSDFRSPAAALSVPVYERDFNGGYFYLIQDIGKSKAQLAAKYEWLDPNTEVEGTDIGITGSRLTAADIRYSTIGIGAIYNFDPNFKMVAWYDIVENEKTNLTNYTQDIEDDVFTLRLQYKF